MEGATESEKNQLKGKDDPANKPMEKSVQIEDLDGTGATQNPGPSGPELVLHPEKTKTVFMNLIHVDEKAQVFKL